MLIAVGIGVFRTGDMGGTRNIRMQPLLWFCLCLWILHFKVCQLPLQVILKSPKRCLWAVSLNVTLLGIHMWIGICT